MIVRTSLHFVPATLNAFIFKCLFITAGIFITPQLIAQCQPEFTGDPADITVDCGEEIPAFGECSAATSACCPGDVEVTSFVSETGNIAESCVISTAYGPGLDWAFWFPGLPAPSVAWHFSGQGNLQLYGDGTGHLWGTIVNAGDASLMMEVDLWFHNGANWEEWSALGRWYKDDLQLAATEHVNWSYYELKEGFANVTGLGALEGTQITLHHMPANFYYGFQSGIAANNKNGNAGFSGWFTYEGNYNGQTVDGHGDVNVDKSCTTGPEGCAATAWTQICRAEDACGNIAFQEQTIYVVDTTAPVVNEYELVISLLCTDYQGVFLTATDDCSSVEYSYTDEVIVEGCNGQVIRHYVIADGCGNSTTADQTINLYGEGDLEFTVFPADTSSECSDVENIPSPDVQWEGGCSNVQLSVTDNIIPGNCEGTYTLQHIYTLTDDCGNEVTQIWTIEVVDTTPPVFVNVPQDITLNCGDDFPEVTAEAFDLCSSIVNISLSATTEQMQCGYLFIRTWTATDACGNEASVSQTITVEDNQNPIFTFVPPNITISCEEEFELDSALVEDACSMTYVEYVDVPTGDCGGSFIRIWRAFDGCGNQAVQSTIVTIVDESAPVMTSFPADIDAACGDIPTVESANIQYSDNCGSVSVNYQEITTGSDCNASLLRVWTLTDDCGNSSEWVWTINLTDSQPPVLIGLPENAALICGDIVPEAVVEAVDNCDTEIVVELVATTQPNACGYDFIRTWTATDDCGNTTQEVRTISFSDQAPPQFDFVPEDINLSCGTGGISLDELPLATATDDCSNVTVTYEDTPQGSGCGDGILRVFTAEDGCGNTVQAQQVITFNDEQAPVFTFVSDDIQGVCGQTIEIPEPVATDNCSEPTITFADVPSQNCGGSFTRIYTATDACGNSADAVVNVTLIDTEAPVVTSGPENGQFECDDIPTVESANLEYSDNCGSVEVSFDETIEEGNCSGSYSIVRTWTLSDDCGNESTYVWTLTIVDTTAPTLIGVPSDITINCGDEVSDAVVVATDNCDANPSVTLSANTIQLECGYLFVRTWTASDACGNESSVSQTITVEDNVPPVFVVVPDDVDVSCNSDGGGDVLGETAQATDECSGVTVTFIDLDNGGEGCSGGFIRQWIATDGCGNQATANQSITIVDQTPPTLISFPEDVTVQSCADIPAVDDAGVTYQDNCTAVTVDVTEEIETLGCANNYVIHRTWTLTDGCGNVTEDTWNIYVVDEQGPTIIGVPEDITIGCDDPIEEAVIIATDNCSASENIQVSLHAKTTDLECGYIFVRIWTAIDECGNSSTATQEITVLDTAPPVIEPLEEFQIFECDQELALVQPTITDACSGFDFTDELVLYNDFESCDGQLFYRIITATDGCGNTSIDTTEVIINDSSAPIPSEFPDDMFVSCDNLPEIGADYVTFEDNCDSSVDVFFEVLGPEPMPFATCSQDYYLVYNWFGTDENCNTTIVSMNVFVSDNQAPVFDNALEDGFLECGEDLPTVEVSATDNCGGDVTIDYNEFITPLPCGYSVMRVWTATDECGNASDLMQTIVFEDTTAPIFSDYPADEFLSCDDNVPDVPEITGFDNCSGEVFVFFNEEIVDGNCPSDFSLIRTWTAEDDCGNVEEYTQTISFTDTQAPQFINFQSELELPCTEINGVYATAMDNCNSVDLIYTDELIGSSCNGTIVRTYIASDDCGNQNIAFQTINLTDSEAPVVTAFPIDVTVDCGNIPTVNEAIVEYQDNCSAVTVDIAEETLDGLCINNYTLVRTWTFSDACGNETQQVWTITVQDNAAPTLIGVPDDVTIDCTDDIPAADVFATDNCSAEPSLSLNAETVFNDCGYTFTRTWTATDDCGNITTDSQVITVSDLFNPTLSEYPGDITLVCGEDIPAAPSITASDNCDTNVDVIFDEQTVGINCPTIVRTWCATDCSGNEECHIQTITFVDQGGLQPNPEKASMDVVRQINGDAFINVKSSKAGIWEVSAFDLKGSLASQLFSGTMDENEERRFVLDGAILKDGVYFVRFSNGDETITKKVVMIH